jgi:hypothetical protein
LYRPPFEVCILDESEKIAGTEHSRTNLLPVRFRRENINQTAGHPIEEIGWCTLEINERTPGISDNRRLFQQLIDNALQKPA